jgi:hypothetical protein
MEKALSPAAPYIAPFATVIMLCGEVDYGELSMATELRSSAKTSGKPSYESFVERQLARVRQRVRIIDFARAGAIFLGIVLGYGLVVGMADRLWDLAVGIRLALWCGLVLGLAVFAGFSATRLCFRQVNPIFLARQLEQTVPDAKNSLINWLDLRGQPLPPVIRGSLGRRAAHDLKEADTDKAISLRPLWWCGGVTLALLLVHVGLLIGSPSQSLSLLRRAYFPFEYTGIATRTQLTLLQPESGNVTVPASQPVLIRVQAAGSVPAVNQPDSLKLHLRYNPREAFEERPLLRDLDGTWSTVVAADQVRNGFYYKITGGDAQLPAQGEYRVDVSIVPQVVRFELTYHYRPYLVQPDAHLTFDKNIRPTIREIRGTQATMVIRANRELKEAILQLNVGGTKKDLMGEPVAGDAAAWKFTWVLDQSGEYRVGFKTMAGEENVDRQPARIEVIPDRAPEVVLTKPAADVKLPANGTLQYEGYASDDFGVKSMQMRLKLLNQKAAPELQPLVYRPGVSFQFTNKKYPQKIECADFVALEKLQTTDGKPFPLSAGMELEYWLEARDNCDYPDAAGNLGQSKHYKLTIDPPQNAAKNKQDRDKIQGDTQQKQKQQDQNRAFQEQVEQSLDSKGAGGSKDDLNKKASDAQKAIDDQNKKGESKDEGPQKDQNGGGGAGGSGKSKGSEGGGGGAGSAQGGQPGDGQQGNDKDGGNQGNDNKSGDSKGGGAGQQQNNIQPGDTKNTPPGGGDGQAGTQKGDGGMGGGSKSAAKSGDMGGMGDAGSARANPDDSMVAGNDKGDGKKADDKSAQPPAGELKGPGPAAKGDSKQGPKNNEATAKGPDGNPGSQADGKDAPPQGADSAGQSKTGDRKDATMQQVQHLVKDLDSPADRDAAKNALEKISGQAADPKVRDAAEEALQKMAARPGAAKGGNPAAMEMPDKGNSPDPKDASAAKNAKADSGAGSQKDAGGSGKPGEAKGSAKTGTGSAGGNQGRIGGDENGPANPLDTKAALRPDDLQLEQLKKRIEKLRAQLTPPVLKELKWTEQDREEFLRQLQADALYRMSRAKAGKETPPPAGSIQALLPAPGPRLVGRDPSLGGGQPPAAVPQPPPDMRLPTKIFQNK